jgi:hypothetical protein
MPDVTDDPNHNSKPRTSTPQIRRRLVLVDDGLGSGVRRPREASAATYGGESLTV